MNLGWLLLVLGPGLPEASFCLYERILEIVKLEPRPAIHMERHIGWTRKLCETESLGISKVGQIVLARLIESQIWYQLAGSVGGGFRKSIMVSVHLDARHLSVSLVLFKLLPWCWSSGSESE